MNNIKMIVRIKRTEFDRLINSHKIIIEIATKKRLLFNDIILIRTYPVLSKSVDTCFVKVISYSIVKDFWNNGLDFYRLNCVFYAVDS